MCSVPLSALLSTGLLLASATSAETVLLQDDFSTARVHDSGETHFVTSGENTYRPLIHAELFAGTTSGSNGTLTFSAVSNSAGYVQFKPVSLACPGDFITLTFKVTYPSGAKDANSGLRYGLYNSLGDISTALAYTTANPVGDTAQGYYVTLNPGGTGAAWSAGSNSINKDLGNRKTIQWNAVNGGAGTAGVISAPSETTFGTATQTVSLTVTRTVTGVSVSAGIAGESLEREDINSYYATFDTFFFGNGASAGAWTMDDLSIVTNVAP